MSEPMHAASDVMTEAELLSFVLDYASHHGWLVHHQWDSRINPRGRKNHRQQQRMSDPGFPDLVLVRNNRCIFAELKRQNGQLTDLQGEWLDRLKTIAEVYVWRPTDISAIETILA